MAEKYQQMECMVLFEQQDFLAQTLANPTNSLPFEQRTLDNGTQIRLLDTGIVEVESAAPQGKNIVLSCAVHGNETAPIEIVNQLLNDILSGSVVCQHRLLLLMGNPQAMVAGTRGIEENMNRLFSGAHSKGVDSLNRERTRAKQLEQAVKSFFEAGEGERFHYDLHTAIRDSKREKFAVYPFRHGKPWRKEQIRFLAGCGVNTILLSHSPTTTFSYFSSNEFGADAFTVELGKVKPFGQNDMSRFEACLAQLRLMVANEPLMMPGLSESVVFDVAQVINKHSEDFRFTFSDDAANFSEFAPDTVLANEDGNAIRVGDKAESIIFPNANVAIGQRALLTVVPTEIGTDFE